MSESGATASALSPTPNPEKPASQAGSDAQGRSRGGSLASQGASARPPMTPLTPGAGAKPGTPEPLTAKLSMGGRSRGDSVQSGAQPGGTATPPVQRTASQLSQQRPPSVPGSAAALSRQASQQSAVPSHHSMRASESGQPPAAPAVQEFGDEVASVHTDVDAATAAVEQPQTPVAAAPAEPQPSDLAQELQEAKAKIYSLEQTNASLNRLMSSGQGDSKIKLMTQEMAKKNERIKMLEAEVKKQTKRAEEAEKKAKSAASQMQLSRRASKSSVGTEKVSSGDKAIIKELQQKLNEAESRAAAAGAQSHAPTPAAHPSMDAGAVYKLQQMVAEREAEKQHLQQKLERAQDAIVSSAGAGFENEVKLQQARSALQCILHSQSPGAAKGGLSLTSGPASTKPKAYYEALANPASYASLASPTSAYSPLAQPRSVSPTRRYTPHY